MPEHTLPVATCAGRSENLYHRSPFPSTSPPSQCWVRFPDWLLAEPGNANIQLVAPSMTEISDNARTKTTTEDFYVQPRCCLSCGVPQSVAPDLVGWTSENSPQCYWIKQPETAAELNQAIKLFQTQELGCHRYSGNNPALLQKLPAEDCDHFHPELKLSCKPYFASSGPTPRFVLSGSEERDVFGRVWRWLLRK
jgi:hypothetical protein